TCALPISRAGHLQLLDADDPVHHLLAIGERGDGEHVVLFASGDEVLLERCEHLRRVVRAGADVYELLGEGALAELIDEREHLAQILTGDLLAADDRAVLPVEAGGDGRIGPSGALRHLRQYGRGGAAVKRVALPRFGGLQARGGTRRPLPLVLLTRRPDRRHLPRADPLGF